MDMQDKEIDNLFRSELESFEIEPSAHLWGNVASAIDKKKSKLKIYLSIAAGLLILGSAGLYFLNRVDNAVKPVQIVKGKKQEPAKQVAVPQVISPKAVLPQVEDVVALNKTPGLRRVKTKRVQAKPALPVQQPQITEQQDVQMAQKVTQLATNDIKFIVPDKQTQLVAKTDVTDDIQFKTNTDAVPTPATKTMAVVPAKKHRIRSLGDLINAVVSKVDKRKDKLIEFSSAGDEDESVVSGLNLGFIKIKKEAK